MPGPSGISAMALPAARAAFGGIQQESVESEPALSETNEAKIPLLTPYQLGPFKLSHRVVLAPLTSVGHIIMCLSLSTWLFTTHNAQPRVVSSLRKPLPRPRLGSDTPTSLAFGLRSKSLLGSQLCRLCTPRAAFSSANFGTLADFLTLPCLFGAQDVISTVGVISNAAYQPNGAPPPSSTNQRVKRYGKTYTKDGRMDDPSEPRAIETHEVPLFVEEFAQAARNAIEAGFDGIELHAANGYLIDQFLRDSANDRTDKYGGSIENRCRFLFEIVKAVGNAIGFERVGVRISPFTDILDVTDSNPDALSLHIAEVLNSLNILYLHVIKPRIELQEEDAPAEDIVLPIRKAYKGNFIAGGGYTRATGIQAIESGKADLIVYGRVFLANPDLPKRFALNAPLNKYDRSTFYTPDPVLGYTDYPFLEEVVKTQS